MHVELIDRLRCTGAHEDSWLVAHADESEDRRIITGTLGCPICHREYRITDGDVWMGDDEPPMFAVDARPDPDAAMRIAALLNVDERGGLYVLGGKTALATWSLGMFENARWILLSPPMGLSGDGVIRGAGDVLPLARGSVRGIAIDRASAALAQSAASVLSPGGRLVAPCDTRLPHGMQELAQDHEQWVAEKVAGYDTGTLVTPRRAAPRTEHR